MIEAGPTPHRQFPRCAEHNLGRAPRAAYPDQEHSGIGRLTWIRSPEIALRRGEASEARGACVTEGTGNREQGTVPCSLLHTHTAVPAGRNTTY